MYMFTGIACESLSPVERYEAVYWLCYHVSTHI